MVCLMCLVDTRVLYAVQQYQFAMPDGHLGINILSFAMIVSWNGGSQADKLLTCARNRRNTDAIFPSGTSVAISRAYCKCMNLLGLKIDLDTKCVRYLV